MDNIKAGFYRHFKGGYVLVLFLAKHSDLDEVEVVYLGLNNGKYYARPVTSFLDTVIDSLGNTVARFTLVSKDEVESLITSDIESIYNTFVN